MARRITHSPRLRFRLLPLTMLASLLLLGIKVGDIVRGTSDLSNLLVSESIAEEKPAESDNKEAADQVDLPESPPKKEDGKAEAEPEKKPAEDEAKKEEPAPKADDASKEEKSADAAKDEDKIASKKEAASDKKDAAKGDDKDAARQQFSQVQLDLLANLAKRREELDQWAKDNQLKESMLQATEQRLNDKIFEIKKLREDVSKLLEQYNQQEDMKIKSLVKIYENMKPKEAARIFEELDMPILLAVVSAMSERRVSPILANMSSKKAKDLTTELAEQRKLNQAAIPTLPPEPPPPSTQPSALN